MERPTDPPAPPGGPAASARAGRGRFGPEHRLCRGWQYRRAFEQGETRRGRLVVAYAHLAPGEPSRAGIIASRKVGDAVRRNLAKRRLRSIVRALWPRVRNDGRQVVLIALPEVTTVDFAQLTSDVTRVLESLGVIEP
jgi:ribonuclease P protein component